MRLQEGPGKAPGFLLGRDDPTVGNPVEDIEGEERPADAVIDAEHDNLGAGLPCAVDDPGRQVSGMYETQRPTPVSYPDLAERLRGRVSPCLAPSGRRCS